MRFRVKYVLDDLPQREITICLIETMSVNADSREKAIAKVRRRALEWADRVIGPGKKEFELISVEKR